MRYVKPKDFGTLKMLFGWGLMNSNIFFLNNEQEGDVQILESNFFHSIIVKGKLQFLKTLWLMLIDGTLLDWHVYHVVDSFVIKLKRWSLCTVTSIYTLSKALDMPRKAAQNS